jgi:hypothetical protein
MKGYKAYKKGLICQDKQYVEGQVYEEAGGVICGSGVMHFCENPLDTLDYYPLIDNNGDLGEFTDVEALADVQCSGNKCATTKLRIGAKLTLAGFITAGIDFIFQRTKIDVGDGAQLASSGYGAQLASSGYGAQLASSGYGARLASSGDNCVVVGIGCDNSAKASIGSWIVLAEWKVVADKSVPVCVKSVQVDGKTIKADTMYKLEDGVFKESNV